MIHNSKPKRNYTYGDAELAISDYFDLIMAKITKLKIGWLMS